MKIRKQDVKSRDKTYAGRNTRKYITIHETGNRSRGADAAAHANLQSRGNVRNASWHFQVDDKEIVRSFRTKFRCWHAGDGRGPGNLESIAIEICVNSDGDYDKALANAQKLVRRLRRRWNIPAENVVQHNRWSSYGKNCPTILRGRGTKAWREFVAGTEPKPKKPKLPDIKLPEDRSSAPRAKTIKQLANEVLAGKHGNGHERRRKSMGITKARYAKVRAEVNRRLG